MMVEPEREDQKPFLEALRLHRVSAEVMHCDHYRVKGGMAVRTDFIVLVQACDETTNNTNTASTKKLGAPHIASTAAELEEEFDPFMFSKTYSAFRSLAAELKNTADAATRSISKLSPTATKVAKYCELTTHLIESQRQQYLGKLTYGHVKALAKQRSQIINGVLEATCHYFPSDVKSDKKNQTPSEAFVAEVVNLIEMFFLTDHCSAEESLVITAKKKKQDDKAFDKEQEQQHHNNPILNPLAGIMHAFDGDKKKNKANKEGGDGKSPATPTGATAAAAATEGDAAGGGGGGTERRRSHVKPITRRDRRTEETRAHDEAELHKTEDATLVLEDYYQPREVMVDSRGMPIPGVTSKNRGGGGAKEDPNKPYWLRKGESILLRNGGNPFFWFGLIGTSMVLLTRAAAVSIRLDADWGLLILFAAYCLGLHTPRPAVPATVTMTTTTTTSSAAARAQAQHLPDRSGRRLIRRTLIQTGATVKRPSSGQKPVDGGSAAVKKQKEEPGKAAGPAEEEAVGLEDAVDEEELFAQEEDLAFGEPMQEFPEGAELGSVLNAWGRSAASDFKIRGPNYLKDKKKIPSQEFLFPVRGVELLLTDACPENVGSNPAIFGGNLRQKPSFLINFRLPWGVCVLYFEIPERFIPYLRACYEPDAFSDKEKAALEASLKTMSPGERCACRFLMKDREHKDKTFKIVPVVVKGPWVVRQVVGGKPAIIGTKLPISYVYQPAQDGGKKALYLEADLDIAASSAARGILSVTRTYTQVLTLDLGFVVQGNAEDELPEQMLLGVRLHGVDPVTAPSYPTMHNEFLAASNGNNSSSEDDDSVTPTS